MFTVYFKWKKKKARGSNLHTYDHCLSNHFRDLYGQHQIVSTERRGLLSGSPCSCMCLFEMTLPGERGGGVPRSAYAAANLLALLPRGVTNRRPSPFRSESVPPCWVCSSLWQPDLAPDHRTPSLFWSPRVWQKGAANGTVCGPGPLEDRYPVGHRRCVVPGS